MSPVPAHAQSATEADINRLCGGLAGAEFNACAERLRAERAQRRSACTNELRAWALSSTEQIAAYRACTGAATLDEFRASLRAQRGGGAQPVAPSAASLSRWFGWKGHGHLEIAAVNSALWTGPMHEGQAQGEGTLTVRLEYIERSPFLGPERKAGELVLAGRMVDGLLDGPVHLRAHPTLPPGPQGLVNQFARGVNQGLPLSQACADKLPVLHEGADVQWLGACNGDFPHAGLAVFSHRGTAFDLACYSEGRFAPPGELAAFNACENYWRHLPGYCKAGTYQGQCRDGRPFGVGVRVETTVSAAFDSRPASVLGALAAAAPGMTSHLVQRGQFQGSFQGYGYQGSVTQCGMAGCSGPRTSETGWFKDGRLALLCEPYSRCLRQTSGADYTAAAATGPQVAAELNALRTRPGFEAALRAFDLGRDREDLRRAAGLAASVEERRALEHTLVRVAGFEKVFALSAEVVTDGRRSVPLSESQILLGLLKDTRSTLPLTVRWEMRNDPAAVALRHGRYSVQATVGVRVTLSRRLCMGELCRNEMNTSTLAQPVSATLGAGQAAARGSFDLRTLAASMGSSWGVAAAETLQAVEPFIRIDAVEPL